METSASTRRQRISTLLAASAFAVTLAIGAGQAASAQAEEPGECQADRSNYLLGGVLTDPLTFVSDLLPFTIAGEQYPVCD